MRYHESNSLFHYTWDQVAQAIWQRYPNPQSTHVLSEDTLSRRIVDGKLLSTRMLVKTNRLPKWGEHIVKARNVVILEHSLVDPVTKVVHTYSSNVGLTKFTLCVERVTYRPSQDNPGETLAERKTWFDSKIFGLRYAVQKFCMDRYKKNISKTDQGFCHVLEKLFPRPGQSTLQQQAASHDAKHRVLDTAQRVKQLLAAEKTLMSSACAEPNT